MLKFFKRIFPGIYLCHDYRISYITDTIATGSRLASQSPPPEIGAVLNVAEEISIYHCNICYKKIPIKDLRPIPANQITEALQWIDLRLKEGRKILVACNAGIGRSTSVVAAYLCCFRGMGFGEAVEFIAAKNPHMSILPGLITGIEEAKKVLEIQNMEEK